MKRALRSILFVAVVTGSTILAFQIVAARTHSCRIDGNEAYAACTLRSLSVVCEKYREDHGTYPGATSEDAFGDLLAEGPDGTPYLQDLLLGMPLKSGYSFTLFGTETTWNCTATPEDPKCGTRSFFCDESAVIRVEADAWANGPATATSRPID